MSIINLGNSFINKSYLAISILGNSLKLNIKYLNNSNSVRLIQKKTEIDLILPKEYKNRDNIDIINSAIKRLYNKIAISELESSMELARYILKFAPEDYKIERITNSFYKCTKNKILVVNPDIVQYNKDVINTTILQAFCKIKYKANSSAYKKALSFALDSYENYKLNSLFCDSIAKVS